MENARDGDHFASECAERVEHDDGDGIIEDRFAKDDRVELRINFVGVEDGENRDGIRGAERRAEDEAFEERQRDGLDLEERPHVDDHADYDRADKGSGEGECEDHAKVAEEVLL